LTTAGFLTASIWKRAGIAELLALSGLDGMVGDAVGDSRPAALF
jgi:hypothetical protein